MNQNQDTVCHRCEAANILLPVFRITETFACTPVHKHLLVLQYIIVFTFHNCGIVSAQLVLSMCNSQQRSELLYYVHHKL